MIVIDEYIATRLVGGDWPAGLPDDDMALPAGRHWRLLQALRGGRGGQLSWILSPLSPAGRDGIRPPHPKVVQVLDLVDWLPRVSDRKVKKQIVRALSVPWAKPEATIPIIEEFGRVDEALDPTATGLRWTIGNALDVLADDSCFEQLVELARTRSSASPGRWSCWGWADQKGQRRLISFVV